MCNPIVLLLKNDLLLISGIVNPEMVLCHCTNGETNKEEFRAMDTLLRKPTLLNMTHIDDISFVDEETLVLNV